MHRFILCAVIGCLLTACGPMSGPGKARTYEYVYKPDGAGPFPAVIVLHSTRGLTADEREWGQRFVRRGYVVLLLDSGAISGSETLAAYGWRTQELKEAIAYLQTLPEVQGQRIAVLGRSHGAGTALSVLAQQNTGAPPPHAVVAFYPRCEPDIAFWRGWTTPVPVLFFHGSADQLMYSCKTWTSRMEKEGRPIQTHIYDGAGHFFDTAGGADAEDADAKVMAFLSQHLQRP